MFDSGHNSKKCPEANGGAAIYGKQTIKGKPENPLYQDGFT
jgi:hypothetical protein